MKVLMITGDRRFGAGHPRYDLQASTVEKLAVVHWGRGALWPKIPQEHFDVVTVQDPFWRGLFAWRVARKLGAKCNVQVHADLSGQSSLKRLLAGFVLRRADSIRVVSERVRASLPKHHTQVAVLPVYVEVEKFRNIVRQPEQNTIVWLGRFESEKDPLLALEVLRQTPNAKLIMVGAGSLEASLREKISRSNLDTRVELRGWQDPAPYLARAGVVLCTSKHESWGESMVEALAAGVPVVAPDVGVAREAGAVIVARSDLAQALTEALRSGARGELKLKLLSREEWAGAWRNSL